VVLSDFYRPTYVAQCQDLASIGDLLAYDAIFVAGGLPSSSDVRLEGQFESKMLAYWREGGAKRLLAIICSGSESMIESDLLAELGIITGSPASRFSLQAALYALGKPLTNYKGLSDQYPAIPYPTPVQSTHAQLVLGRNPDASPYFCAAIGNTWMQLGEKAPGEEQGEPLHLWDGVFRSSQLTPVTSLDQLPPGAPLMRNRAPTSLSSTALAGVRVGMLLASGAHDGRRLSLRSGCGGDGGAVPLLNCTEPFSNSELP
jgi:putative intracellular protease/amidase